MSKFIVIAALPKSGSTWLQASLMQGTQCMVLDLGHASTVSAQDQNFCPSMTHFLQHPQGITKQHFIPTEYERLILNDPRVHVVVLTRKLPDAIVSMRDHLDAEHDVYTDPLVRMPTIHIPRKQWMTLTPEGKLWYLVLNWAPWVVQFVSCWWELGKEFKTHWVDYDDMMLRKGEVLESIAKEAGRPFELEKVDLESKNWRFNKGVSGRGEDELSTEMFDALGDYLMYLPDEAERIII